MSPRTALRHLLLGAIVLAGLALGHDLVFRLAADGPAERADLLVETGHGAWTPARMCATLLVFGFVLLAAPAPRRVVPARLVSAYGRTVARLVLLQTAGFVALELGERLTHGPPLTELALDPVLAVGALVQLAVGLLGALLLVAVHRLVTGLPTDLQPGPPGGSRANHPPSRLARPPRFLFPGTGPRAPPCVA